MGHPFTVGVEEEFQIVDPATWELRSHVSELLASGAATFGDHVKRELHQSIVEVGTKICSGVDELCEEIIRSRRGLADAAERVGLRVAAAGTHPFSNWTDQVLSPGERYQNIVDELQQLARSLLIFGLHVHIGIPDQALTIELMNEVRYFLPHLLALSTSSPFWMGRDTGLKSYRTMVFRRFPRTGIPDRFESWSEYQEYIDLLVELHSLDSAPCIERPAICDAWCRRSSRKRARASSNRRAPITCEEKAMKVGLLCGREYAFPPAFVDRVNRLGGPHDVTAELVKLTGTRM